MEKRISDELNSDIEDAIDELEGKSSETRSPWEIVYDMIRHINDPEHPNTLEELSVVYPAGITIN